jgi:hypothetical protein
MFHCVKETGIGVPARPRNIKEVKEMENRRKCQNMSKDILTI